MNKSWYLLFAHINVREFLQSCYYSIWYTIKNKVRSFHTKLLLVMTFVFSLLILLIIQTWESAVETFPLTESRIDLFQSSVRKWMVGVFFDLTRMCSSLLSQNLALMLTLNDIPIPWNASLSAFKEWISRKVVWFFCHLCSPYSSWSD